MIVTHPSLHEPVAPKRATFAHVANGPPRRSQLAQASPDRPRANGVQRVANGKTGQPPICHNRRRLRSLPKNRTVKRKSVWSVDTFVTPNPTLSNRKEPSVNRARALRLWHYRHRRRSPHECYLRESQSIHVPNSYFLSGRLSVTNATHATNAFVGTFICRIPPARACAPAHVQ